MCVDREQQNSYNEADALRILAQSVADTADTLKFKQGRRRSW